jgi:hypothetical protein
LGQGAEGPSAVGVNDEEDDGDDYGESDDGDDGDEDGEELKNCSSALLGLILLFGYVAEVAEGGRRRRLPSSRRVWTRTCSTCLPRTT